MVNEKDETGFTRRIGTRDISIADDGFASVIGIGRISLLGLINLRQKIYYTKD